MVAVAADAVILAVCLLYAECLLAQLQAQLVGQPSHKVRHPTCRPLAEGVGQSCPPGWPLAQDPQHLGQGLLVQALPMVLVQLAMQASAVWRRRLLY